MIRFQVGATTNNVGTDVVGFGRYAQTAQWSQVLTNVQNFISGELISKTLHKEIYNQDAKSGDAKKVVDQDLQTETCTESYEECK